MIRVIHSRDGQPIVHQWSMWKAIVLCRAAADDLGMVEEDVEYSLFVGNTSLPGGEHKFTNEYHYVNANDTEETIDILPGDELDLSY